MFGIEEAVKEAQAGGSGVVIYFRKEGRALGEVTKYLVYNVRKRTGDRASEYFERTESIAGVKDVISTKFTYFVLIRRCDSKL